MSNYYRIIYLLLPHIETHFISLIIIHHQNSCSKHIRNKYYKRYTKKKVVPILSSYIYIVVWLYWSSGKMIIDRNLCHTIIIIKIIHPDLGNIFFSKFLYLFKTKLEYIYNLNIPTKKKKGRKKTSKATFFFIYFRF